MKKCWFVWVHPDFWLARAHIPCTDTHEPSCCHPGGVLGCTRVRNSYKHASAFFLGFRQSRCYSTQQYCSQYGKVYCKTAVSATVTINNHTNLQASTPRYLDPTRPVESSCGPPLVNKLSYAHAFGLPSATTTCRELVVDCICPRHCRQSPCTPMNGSPLAQRQAVLISVLLDAFTRLRVALELCKQV